ncbi:hypothetical protein [Nostoc sp. FACHB-280]|uniref:hypothetical protein n=1 Tax=Nostoc sp. FACHB-280 TaxID=2692839 RepID=UPI00168A63EB|nr:hypothetical protein [Nostoc sp. FACHB-280]MBD2495225.1 hypothetical protein [Nostoc sp. FACHB-280]
MKVERPLSQEPTPEEVRELEKLKTMIEQYVQDGEITHQEIQNFYCAMFAHGKPSADQIYRSLELYRNIVEAKINKLEVWYEPPSN